MATPSKKPARPTSNAKLAEKYEDLDRRLKAIEDMVEAAQTRQAQLAAQRLAQNPEQLAQLQQVLDMASKATPAAATAARVQ